MRIRFQCGRKIQVKLQISFVLVYASQRVCMREILIEFKKACLICGKSIFEKDNIRNSLSI